MAAVNEMRLPDFSVCLQAQAGIMPLKGKCIPRVQRVVLIVALTVENSVWYNRNVSVNRILFDNRAEKRGRYE